MGQQDPLPDHRHRWARAPSEPCYVFHPLNAYDTDDGSVIVDVVRWPSKFDADRLGPSEGPTRLDRWTLDPSTGKAVGSTLDDHSIELPRHDERRIGQPYRFGYAPSVLGQFDQGNALKHDLVAGAVEVHDYGPGRTSGELVFVPRADDANEDDGWLLSLVHDAATDRSDLVILHAQDFTGNPVATIHLPQRVPVGFHGNWIPNS